MIDVTDVITCARAIKKTPLLAHGPAGAILSIEVILELATRLQVAEAALTDFRDHGLRADLNPTGVIRDCNHFEPEMGWHEYLKSIEANVKERAVNALPKPPSVIV